jgi:hypothetical protein
VNQFGYERRSNDNLTSARQQMRVPPEMQRNDMSKKTKEVDYRDFEDKVTSVTIGEGQPVFKPSPAADEPRAMEGLTEGRMCHFVIPDGPQEGTHRPAIVVHVGDSNVVNLQVFTDGRNDGADTGTRWVQAVKYSEDKTPGTWHWIEKA